VKCGSRPGIQPRAVVSRAREAGIDKGAREPGIDNVVGPAEIGRGPPGRLS